MIHCGKMYTHAWTHGLVAKARVPEEHSIGVTIERGWARYSGSTMWKFRISQSWHIKTVKNATTGGSLGIRQTGEHDSCLMWLVLWSSSVTVICFWVFPLLTSLNLFTNSLTCHIAQDHMSPLLVAPPGVCPLCAESGWATIKHDDGIFSILRLVISDHQPVLAMVDDSIVGYLAFGRHTVYGWELCKYPSNTSIWLWLPELSHMCSYGHQNMKPTVVFGSSWEPQDMTFRMWKHAHACIIMCDLNHHDSKPYRVTVHCAD